MKHVPFITHPKRCSEPIVSGRASSLASRAKFYFAIHQTLANRELCITVFVQNAFDLGRNIYSKKVPLKIQIFIYLFTQI